jgi:putative membrane protein
MSSTPDHPNSAEDPQPLGDADGSRRTGLAGERTLLAWWRTGLAAIAVAIAVGRLLPELSETEHHWPFVVLGAGFAVYGIAMVVFGMQRIRQLEREQGITVSPAHEDKMLLSFTVAGVVLGLGSLAVIFA